MHDKLQEHYTRPRPQRSYPAGYDPDDIAAIVADVMDAKEHDLAYPDSALLPSMIDAANAAN